MILVAQSTIEHAHCTISSHTTHETFSRHFNAQPF